MVPARAVRLDSGDLAEHARKARRMFDDGRLRAVSIFASGGLLTLESEQAAGEALIRPVMRPRPRLELPALEDARRFARAQLERLPAPLKRLECVPGYPIEGSGSLQALARESDRLEMIGG